MIERKRMLDRTRAAVVSSEPAEAVRMLDLFGAIGATHFDITHIHLCGEKRGFRRNRSITEVRRLMPHLVTSAVLRQDNVILRPRVVGPICIQLDDLDPDKLAMISSLAFLTIETSPGNYQAWVAVADPVPGIATRLRKGTDADLNASGATRVAGTKNFKLKFEPTFPLVRIVGAQRGRIVNVAELETRGVLATESESTETNRSTSIISFCRRPQKWPSYERCLERAPVGSSGNPKRTSADFTWCLIAASWGHPVEAIEARLLDLSTKAQENGKGYARKTAERAKWAAARRMA
jgi:hypothetical protein